MKNAEQVTFGGSGLDRAGEIRGNPQALADAAADPTARAVVFWRGKPLVSTERPAGLIRLGLDHAALKDAAEAPILLGREDGGPTLCRRFVCLDTRQSLMKAALAGFLTRLSSVTLRCLSGWSLRNYGA